VCMTSFFYDISFLIKTRSRCARHPCERAH